MKRAGLYLLLTFFSGATSATTIWNGIGPQSVTRGSGDVLAASGAAVTVSGESMGDGKFVGALASLDARAFQGREVRLAGTLRVVNGGGDAALWLRADGPKGRLAFDTSGSSPVRLDDGSRERELWVYVPSSATSLKFGVTLSSAGRADVERLRLVTEAPASPGISAHDVLTHALHLIRANALNAANIDWTAEEAALITPDLKGLPAQDAYDRIRSALNKLEDHHSFVQMPRAALLYRQSAVATQAIDARQLQDVGYLLVPGLRGTDTSAGAGFTAELCKQVLKLAPRATKGFILDLRYDTGGNMWPMLYGLYPLLGTGNIGAIRNREGAVINWRSRATPACGVDLAHSRVAVLVGVKTASAGEAIAVAFMGRPQTHFFGQPTAGLSTSNRHFALPDGGALRLTTSVMLDRAGAAYPHGVSPETLVSGEAEAVEKAAEWLRSKP